MAVIPFVNDYSNNTNEFGQKAQFVGVTENPSGSSQSIPVIYGQRRVEGIRFFNLVSPTDTTVLYAAYALSEDWCQGMTQLFVDDTLVRLAPTDFVHRVPVQVTQGKYAGVLEIEFVDGRNANAYYGSVTNIGASTMLARDFAKNYNWGNLCYIVCKFTYIDKGAFSQVPKITVDLSGRKIPVWDTASNTTVYSDNPALIIWDLMSNPVYGRGITKDKIDAASFTEVQASCNLVRKSIYNKPVFSVNWICDTSSSLLNNIKLVLETFQLNLSFIQNKWVLTAEQSPVANSLTFTDTNIVDGVQIQYPSVNERYNRVIIDYIEPTYNFQSLSTQFPPVGDNTYLTEDNGLILEKRITCNMVTNALVANDIAQMTLKRSRNQITYRFRATKDAHQCRIGDYAFITTTIPYINNQKVVIISMTMQQDYTFDMECVSYDPTWYPSTFTNSVTLPTQVVPPPVVVPTASWSIVSTRDATSYTASEGQSIVWTVKTLNVSVGTTFQWKITGSVSTADFAVGYTTLTGTDTLLAVPGSTTGECAVGIVKATANPNARTGPRTIIFTIYDSSGVTQLAQHQLTLVDPGSTAPSVSYTYVWPGAVTLDAGGTGTNATDWYLAYSTNSDAYTHWAAKTKSGSSTTQLGYQSLVKNLNGVIVYELNFGLIDRLAANQALNRKIYYVYKMTYAANPIWGYWRQSGNLTTLQATNGMEMWTYDPDLPPVASNKIWSLISGGNRYNSGNKNLVENVTANDTALFDAGAIQMINVKPGQYASSVPLRFKITPGLTPVNKNWPITAGNGSFFGPVDWTSSSLTSGFYIDFCFFQWDATTLSPMKIGTKTINLAMTTAKMSAGDLDGDITASRTAWASTGWTAQF